MAVRPVFVCKDSTPFFKETLVDFKYYSGFSESQHKLSVNSLHSAYKEIDGNATILEISNYSSSLLGKQLSAFNLMYVSENVSIPVECVFQSSKVFENGGPYIDLLYRSPRDAKKDERLKTSGNLIAFKFFNEEFPLKPQSFFYDYVYAKALAGNPKLVEAVLKYDSFTDIVFNPQKSINCQARSVAIFVSLCRAGKAEEALKDRQSFLEMVYSYSSLVEGELKDDVQIQMPKM